MRPIRLALTLSSALVISLVPTAAAASSPGAEEPVGTPATAGKAKKVYPLIHAHRGASGYRPEHTQGAYELAVAMGADYIEPDLVMTKDGVLVDRHEPEISGTTDVATHPEFAARKTTKQVDGTSVTGWFVEDFTLKELKTLRAVERLPKERQENTIYNGRWDVPTFEEVLQWRQALSRRYGRQVGIIPEIKHSTYLHAQGLNPEAAFVALAKKYDLNRPKAPIWLQSFEWTNLVELRTKHGYRGNEVFLADSKGGPYDLVAKGAPRSYDDMLTAASLKTLAKTVDGIGPYKERVIPRAGDGLGAPTSLVRDAHAAGLTATVWTMRAENNWLPKSLWLGTNPNDFGKALDEDIAYMKAGVDGLFCDQPDVCVEARKDYWRQMSSQ